MPPAGFPTAIEFLVKRHTSDFTTVALTLSLEELLQRLHSTQDLLLNRISSADHWNDQTPGLHQTEMIRRQRFELIYCFTYIVSSGWVECVFYIRRYLQAVLLGPSIPPLSGDRILCDRSHATNSFHSWSALSKAVLVFGKAMSNRNIDPVRDNPSEDFPCRV